MAPDRAPHERAATAPIILRNDARLTLLRPGSGRPASLPLEADGTSLCVSLSGTLVLSEGERSRFLPRGVLHILRQRADSPRRRIDFAAPSALGAVAFLSTRWSSACPRGSTCEVARFLRQGGDAAPPPTDGAIELDDAGLRIVHALLDSHEATDAAALSVEQSVLALISWAFAKHAEPIPPAVIPARALNPRLAMKARQAAEILRQRLGDPPTTAELSALVALNESDLKRSFKSVHGATIAGYSRRKRLETARDLLAHSTLGIAEVSLEVGFANPSQFARAFRRHFGLNPSRCRQRLP
jgi:AraC-like DNA-binding protein